MTKLIIFHLQIINFNQYKCSYACIFLRRGNAFKDQNNIQSPTIRHFRKNDCPKNSLEGIILKMCSNRHMFLETENFRGQTTDSVEPKNIPVVTALNELS